MPKERIDKLVVERGLAQSRTQAQALILAGQVLVAEQRVDKPGQMVNAALEIRIKGELPRYVGRGGLKLEAALSEFNIDVTGKQCLDVGASTGGFTDCLLQHGAAHVWAIDAGHNQLVWKLRQDSRVTVREGVNARYLDAAQFPLRFDFATIDVSFISLKLILPAVAGCLQENADCIALIKPQFEVGKGEVGKGGIVSEPTQHRRVVEEISRAASAINLHPLSLIESPILGAEGNREFLIRLRRTSAAEPISSLLKVQIDKVIG